MTIAEKVTRAKADIDATYNAGYANGVINASGEYPLSVFIASKHQDYSYLFHDCRTMTEIPVSTLDTSHVTNMGDMFSYCSILTTVPLLDTSNVTHMGSMFMYCKRLTTVPLFNTSNVTNMNNMFSYCYVLTSVPLFDTRKVTNMLYMLYECRALTTVPEFDIRNVTNSTHMFYNCFALTDVRIRNIKTNLQVGSGTSWGHLLTVDSLVHLIYELRDTGSTKTLTVGSANLEKLANVYVKLVDITDEMRAEDDLIDEKLPFVVCESTDEGAALIKDYVSLKNWQLA